MSMCGKQALMGNFESTTPRWAANLCRVNVREYEQMIQAVTGKQIAEFTRRLLASKPSLAAFGDGTEALSYDQLVERLGKGNWGQRSSNPMGLRTAMDDQQSGVFERLVKGLSMGGGRSITSSSSSSSSNSSSSSSSTGGKESRDDIQDGSSHRR